MTTMDYLVLIFAGLVYVVTIIAFCVWVRQTTSASQRKQDETAHNDKAD